MFNFTNFVALYPQATPSFSMLHTVKLGGPGDEAANFVLYRKLTKNNPHLHIHTYVHEYCICTVFILVPGQQKKA